MVSESRGQRGGRRGLMVFNGLMIYLVIYSFTKVTVKKGPALTHKRLIRLRLTPFDLMLMLTNVMNMHKVMILK